MFLRRVLIIIALLAAVAAMVLSGYPRLVIIPEKRDVTAGLKDPDTAEFRNERLAADGVLCGEINARNSYGAYTGYKRYIAMAADDVYLEGEGFVGKRNERNQLNLDAAIAAVALYGTASATT
jgi:hypothetical protein